MQIPGWLKGHLDESGIARIRAAVDAAEARTSGEIVPMIVHRSTRTGHAPWLLFFIFVALFSGAFPFLNDMYWGVPAWGIEVGAVFVSAVLAYALSRIDTVRRMCVPDADRDASVLMRAELEFFESEIKKTQGKTGILIFVSLFEHEAVVLADEGISKHFPPETWEGILESLIGGVRQRDFAGGMCKAIEMCANLLAERFPRAANDRDELSNRLIIQE